MTTNEEKKTDSDSPKETEQSEVVEETKKVEAPVEETSTEEIKEEKKEEASVEKEEEKTEEKEEKKDKEVKEEIKEEEGEEVEVPKKFKKLVDEIESMSVLDLNELVKLLKRNLEFQLQLLLLREVLLMEVLMLGKKKPNLMLSLQQLVIQKSLLLKQLKRL